MQKIKDLKTLSTKMLAVFLAVLMFASVFVEAASAINRAYDEAYVSELTDYYGSDEDGLADYYEQDYYELPYEPEETDGRRHPGLTGMEALLADYAAGDVRQATRSDCGRLILYDGVRLYLPSSLEQSANPCPAVEAVLSKGLYTGYESDEVEMAMQALAGIQAFGIQAFGIQAFAAGGQNFWTSGVTNIPEAQAFPLPASVNLDMREPFITGIHRVTERTQIDGPTGGAVFLLSWGGRQAPGTWQGGGCRCHVGLTHCHCSSAGIHCYCAHDPGEPVYVPGIRLRGGLLAVCMNLQQSMPIPFFTANPTGDRRIYDITNDNVQTWRAGYTNENLRTAFAWASSRNLTALEAAAVVHVVYWMAGRGLVATNPATSSNALIRNVYNIAIGVGDFTPPPPSRFRLGWVHTEDGIQNLLTGFPVNQHIILPDEGSLRINKTVENYPSRAGFEFQITGPNGFNITQITNESGVIYLPGLEPGVYTIRENVPAGFVLQSPNPQTVTVVNGVSGASAPTANFHNILNHGSLRVNKTVEHWHTRAGFEFQITGPGGFNRTITTDAAGQIYLGDLDSGVYTIREIVPPGFILHSPNPQTVTVTAGASGADAPTANFHNAYNRGSLRVNKTVSNWHTRAGFEFQITGPGGFNRTITTDATGQIYLNNLDAGVYTIREIVPSGFVLQSANPQTITVLPGVSGTNAPSATFHNIRQLGRITIDKRDFETGNRAQGDATLAGAVFAIYAAEAIVMTNGQLIAPGFRIGTVTTDANGRAVTPLLDLGRYEVVEITRPNGYMPDVPHTNGAFANINAPLRRHVVNVTPSGTGVVVEHSLTVQNHVIQGRMRIIKFGPETDDMFVREPLAGVVFNVWLQSAGSFAAAQALGAADTVTTNRDGIAYTRFLPYGRYVIEEVYAPGDMLLAPGFVRYLTNNPENHRATWQSLVENIPFDARVRVEKTDCQTGETIPTAGVEFRIFNVSTEEWVSQRVFNPTTSRWDDVSTFVTNDEGWFITPLALRSGQYRLYEISAPYGYVLRNEPLDFVIYSTSDQLRGRPAVFYIEFANEPAMGVINVEKLGYTITGYERVETEHGVMYELVWGLRPLEGVTFEVRALEDITTPDGTVRVTQGEVVETLVTDSYGRIQSSPLFLGRYEVVEIETIDGFILSTESIEVTLEYADQYTAIVHSETMTKINDRPLAELQLEKQMELGTGMVTDFSGVVFGVFAPRTNLAKFKR